MRYKLSDHDPCKCFKDYDLLVFNISLVHYTPKEKYDMTKNSFYERLEHTHESYPVHDVKTVICYFNGRLGKQDIFSTAVCHKTPFSEH